MPGDSRGNWRDKSREYAEMAEEMFGNGFYRDTCYFSYQAVNSFLRGALLRVLEINVQAHNLARLYEMLSEDLGFTPSPEALRCLEALSERHVKERRHRAQITELSEEEGRNCLECLKKVLGELEEATKDKILS